MSGDEAKNLEALILRVDGGLQLLGELRAADSIAPKLSRNGPNMCRGVGTRLKASSNRTSVFEFRFDEEWNSTRSILL